jgi:hypothetical protein
MSADRETTRIVRSWLREDGHENADRVLDLVLDQIDTTPQRRATWWPVRRLLTMNNTMRYAVAAVVLSLAALVGLTLLNNQIGNEPTPTPSPSDTALGPLPDELQHPFLGEPRPLPGVTPDPSGAYLIFDGSTFSFGNGEEAIMSSTASVDSTGHLRLSTVAAGRPCAVGDEGLYEYSFSPGGSRLTITGTDDCAAREAAVVGTWQTSDCRNQENFCLGNLEPGTYSSNYFEPRPHGDWAPRFGALSYTVPEGWAATYDYPEMYSLMTQQAYATDDPGDAIQVWAAPRAAAEDCKEAVAQGVGTSPADIAGWVRQQPGIDIGEPESITIGGYDGFVLDVEVAAGQTGTCGAPGIPLFYGGWQIAVSAGDRQRFVIVDLGKGDSALIVIDTLDPDTLDVFVSQAMPIVETFEFPPR